MRTRAGTPEGLFKEMEPAMTAPHGGRTLVYLCVRGSPPGMAMSKAAALERQRFHPGCSDGLC